MPIHSDASVRLSPVFFTIGLVTAAFAATWLDYAGRLASRSEFAEIAGISEPPIVLQAPKSLTEEDLRSARIAWAYIEGNTRVETGLVDSVAGFPSTTLWDQASYLLGLVSAYRLEIIPEQEFLSRTAQLIASFEKMPLVDGALPNKAYDTRSLTITDYQNNASDAGIGWSALDVARMMLAFRILERHTPEFGPQIRSVLRKWDLNALSSNGELFGSLVEGRELQYLQEGRIGYEQYGARAAAMWGVDVTNAISAQRNLEWRTVSDTPVPADLRRSTSFRAITPTLSEPYMLMGLEMGLDSEAHILASQVYRAQEARFRETGLPTMVSEDHVDEAPFFLYSSVFSNGQDWAVVSENGDFYPQLRTVSVKASFAWDALFGTEYSALMREQIADLAREDEGWMAGVYEASKAPNAVFTLNTNGIILAAIHYKAFGPLWHIN